MLLGICQQQPQKPIGLADDQIPKIRRAFGQRLHKRADDRPLGKQTFEGFGVRPPIRSASQSDTRNFATSGSLNRGAVLIRSASAAPLAAAALSDLRASFLGEALRLAGRLIRKSVPALAAARQ